MRVVGVEPIAGGVTERSLEAGERLSIDVPRTIADGQQLTTPARLTFEVMQRHVDEVVLMDDNEIVGGVGVMITGGNVGSGALTDLLSRARVL